MSGTTRSAVTVGDLLTAARRDLARLTPREAADAQRSGALLVDIRSESQMVRDGVIPGAIPIPRNVLEWRLDPRSPDALPELVETGQVIVICDEGYQSSLAAAVVPRFDVDATDVVGGFQAWRDAGGTCRVAPSQHQP